MGLRIAIDQVVDGPPRATESGSGVVTEAPGAGAAQVVLDLAGDPGSALHRIGVWMSTRALLESSGESRMLAEAVLRGAPEAAPDPAKVRALMRAYLGTVVVTPEGRDYRLAPEGLQDPLRGTYPAPEWPALPVPGSVVDRALGRLVSLRTGLSFDREPGVEEGRPLESLHGRARFGLRTR